MAASIRSIARSARHLRFLSNHCQKLNIFPIRCISVSSPEEKNEFSLRYLDEYCDGVAVFAFNRPEARNAMSISLMKKLGDAIDVVRFDKNLRVVILRSDAPGIFCAGADLKERARMKEHEVAPLLVRIRGLLRSLASLPMPTIAAIDGYALGGGLEMAMSCDLRVAAGTAKMGLTETKLAIIPGGGGTQNLPRLVGSSVAKDLIFTGRMVDGVQAQSLGLVNEAVPQNEAGDAAYRRAVEIAATIVPQGPVALRMAKQAINQGMQTDINTALEIEQTCYAQVIPTKDRMEGLMAFREKRPPQYTGE